MPFELINTSAPRGIDQGSRGFTTVAITQGLTGVWRKRLESMSGYFIEDGITVKPTIYSHLHLTIAGSTRNVLSRVGPAGLDYSGRPNRIAHHILLDSSELPLCGPAILAHQQNLFCDVWVEDPAILPTKQLYDANCTVAPCHYWKEVTGCAGNAGHLLRHLFSGSKKPLFVIAKENVDCLRLFTEAIALLNPVDRWKATFTTLSQQLPSDATCGWKVIIANTKTANSTLHIPGTTVINLSSTPDIVEDEYSSAALTGTPIPPSQSFRQTIVVPDKKKKTRPGAKKLIQESGDAFGLEPLDSNTLEPNTLSPSKPTKIVPTQPFLDQQPLVGESLYQATPPNLGWQYDPNENTRGTSRLPWIFTGVASFLVIVLLVVLFSSNRDKTTSPRKPTDAVQVDSGVIPPAPSEEPVVEKDDDIVISEEEEVVVEDETVEEEVVVEDETVEEDVVVEDETVEEEVEVVEKPQQNEHTMQSFDVFALDKQTRYVYVGEGVEFFFPEGERDELVKKILSPGNNIVHWTWKVNDVVHTVKKQKIMWESCDPGIKEVVFQISKTVVDAKTKKESEPTNLHQYEIRVEVKEIPDSISAKKRGVLKPENWLGQIQDFQNVETGFNFYYHKLNEDVSFDWRPIRSDEGIVLEWQLVVGGSKITVSDSGSIQSISWNGAIDFIIIATNETDKKWYTLLSQKRMGDDKIFTESIDNKVSYESFPQLKETHMFSISKSVFNNAVPPYSKPIKPFFPDPREGWEFEKGERGNGDKWKNDIKKIKIEYTTNRNKLGNLAWRVDSPNLTEPIYLYDTYGRLSLTLKIPTPPNDK